MNGLEICTDKCNIETCWAQWEKWCLDASEYDVSYFYEWVDEEPRRLNTLFDYN